MDPNATLQFIDDALNDYDHKEARYLVAELAEWLRRGGFEPDWNDYPRATACYKGYN